MGNTDLYLRALALRHKFAEEPIREAVALLEQALALSPADAPAAAMIAWLWVHQVGVWHAVSDAEITEALLLVGYGADAFVPSSAVPFGRRSPLRSSIIAVGLRYSGRKWDQIRKHA